MTHRIALIGGDGIGPEVVAEAVKVLDTAAGHGAFEWVELPYSADFTLETGVTILEPDLQRLSTDYDAVLLGALGDPRIPDMRHARDVLLGARKGHDLYINLRPISLIDARLTPLKGRQPADIDLVIFRENTEGVYVDIGGTMRRGTPHELAVNQMVATRMGTERIIRAAFQHARDAGVRRVCMVSKHNAISHAHGLWARLFRELATEYPDITPDRLFADVAAMELVRNPARFDVIVCSNFIGDVLGDLAAQLVGGLGMAPSGNIRPADETRPRMGLFEPVHGSAPDLAGSGRANPFAAILSGAMMAEFLDLPELAARVRDAVHSTVIAGHWTADLGGQMTTGQVGDQVCDAIGNVATSTQGD